MLPHAIIALNESSIELPPWHWDTGYTTRWLLDKYHGAIHRNPGFEPYVEFWRKKSTHIDSLEGLLKLYYSSVTVVKIPSGSRPNLICEQIEKLYDEIRNACKTSLSAKQSVRMLFTANELHPYLVSAFDHFATSIDDPFDFVQFSFTNSPIPLDFAGNIVKLAIKVMNFQPHSASMASIFQELSYIIASCIMLDAARHRKIGTSPNP